MAGEVTSTSDQSDEVSSGFTGIMIGICGQDVKYRTKNADFDYFELKALE